MPMYLIGAFFLCLFGVVRLGWIKSWFVLKTLPGLISARMIFMLFPMGLTWIAGGIAATYSSEGAPIFSLVFCSFIITTFAFMVWPPNWVKPAWLRWLDQEYGYCLDILVEEAQKFHRWDWEIRVRTQVGMQAWIDEVFACRKKEINELWVLEKHRLLTQQTSREKKLRKVGIRLTENVPDHRKGDTLWTQSDEDIYRQYMQRMIG